jgi:hypothetical protein
MSNIADTTGFEGLLSKIRPGGENITRDEFTEVLKDLVSRLETSRRSVNAQLNGQVHVFTVDPASDPEGVAGAKTGDLAVYEDSSGDSQVKRYNEGDGQWH